MVLYTESLLNNITLFRLKFSVFSFIVLWTLRLYIVLFIEAANPFGFASDEAAVPMLTYLDLPFAMYTNPKR